MAGRFSLVRKGYAEMDDTNEMIEDWTLVGGFNPFETY